MKEDPKLKRKLTLWGLIAFGMVVIQPTAPMGIYGVVSNKAHGHVVTTILIAMVAMLFTAFSYGWMARRYPSAGSAYTYVSSETNSLLGFIVGWGLVLDYLLNPLICMAFCAKATENIIPHSSYYFWILVFAILFTLINVFGIEVSARVNGFLCVALTAVVVIFLSAAALYVWHTAPHAPHYFRRPFYDPATFNFSEVLGGTSIAALTYIGFDAVSTLSEEAKNPRRNIFIAIIVVCLITGILSALEVYGAQLVWGSRHFGSNDVESAFALLSRQAGGAPLFHLINISLLVATVGSGMGSQLAAGRILYSLGRTNALPASIFGVVEPKKNIPRRGIMIVGVVACAGAALLELCGPALGGGGAYAIGAEMLNFGAFLAFMGVNAACFLHYWRRSPRRLGLQTAISAVGFIICAYIWFHLSSMAIRLGTLWMLLGLGYRFLRIRSLGSGVFQFDRDAEGAGYLKPESRPE